MLNHSRYPRTNGRVLMASNAGFQSPSVAGHVRAPDATNPWLVVVIVCVAQFMVVLDATIVNVALPSIQRGLRFQPVEPAMGDQHVHADLRRVHAVGRARRRPDRAQAGVRRRDRAVLRSVAAQRPRPVTRDADRRPGAARARGRAARAGRPVDHHDDLQRRERIARRRWRSGARSPPAAARWGCCWAGC